MHAHSAETVAYEVQGPLGVITFTRPHKRNALTFAMWNAIPHALTALVTQAHSGVRTIVLQGAGHHFGAGADLGEVQAATASLPQARTFCRAIATALQAIARCPLPTVACLRGVAIGGAAEMALAADFRVADTTAVLHLPFVRLGMVPDMLTVKRLTDIVGDSQARHMLFSAGHYDAAHCLALKIVQQVSPPQNVWGDLQTFTAPFSEASPYVIEHCKHMQWWLTDEDLADLAEARAQSFIHGGVRAAADAFHKRGKAGPVQAP